MKRKRMKQLNKKEVTFKEDDCRKENIKDKLKM